MLRDSLPRPLPGPRCHQLCTKGVEAGPEGGLADRYLAAMGEGKVPQENQTAEAKGSCGEACPDGVKIPSELGKMTIHLV